MYARYAKLRDERGMNNLQVANATGIPQSTLYDWGQRDAKGKKANMSVDNLAKLARFFEVPIEYFLEKK